MNDDPGANAPTEKRGEVDLPTGSRTQRRTRATIRTLIVLTAFAAASLFGILALRHLWRPPQPAPMETTGTAPASNASSPIPPDPDADPLLRPGKEIYLARCVSCHGPAGKGDGPLARALPPPAPRDLTSAHWKHGDSPEAALEVVSRGVNGTSMAGWASMLGPEGTRSVTAYCLLLGRRPVPDAWRADAK